MSGSWCLVLAVCSEGLVGEQQGEWGLVHCTGSSLEGPVLKPSQCTIFRLPHTIFSMRPLELLVGKAQVEVPSACGNSSLVSHSGASSAFQWTVARPVGRTLKPLYVTTAHPPQSPTFLCNIAPEVSLTEPTLLSAAIPVSVTV